MWSVWIYFSFLVMGCVSETNNYCKELNPQTGIDIDQLMGMWYGIEIIIHDSERHYVRQIPSCPIIHISQDRSYNSLYNVLHKDYNYNYNYGQGHGTYNPLNVKGGMTTYPQPPYNQDQYNRDRSTYNRDRATYNRDPYNRDPYSRDPYNRVPTTRDPYNRDQYNRDQYNRDQYNKDPYNRDQYNNQDQLNRNRFQKGYQNRDPYYREPTSYDVNKDYYPNRYPSEEYARRYNEETKRLTLWWDENGGGTEYRIRYNVNKAGFWISSGPQNGSSLEPLMSHFAGTIQVLKVVGNHLVLNFCHQQPDRRHYTVILSRQRTLNVLDVSGVHGLLHRKGLGTNDVKKVCNSGVHHTIHNFILIFIVCWYLDS